MNLTDGQAHEVALYLLDWDFQSRAQTVTVSDAATGTPLDTQSVSSFTNGTYLVWNLSGDVTINLACTGGTNAVASGIFCSPAATNPNGSAAATFVHADTSTQGTWQGVYGSNGYDLLADTASVPGYASVGVQGAADCVWASGTTDVRAAQDPTSGSRTAACDYSGTSFGVNLDLNLGSGPHQVALYLVDFDGLGRSETVRLADAYSGQTLDTQSVSNFTSGIYLVYVLSGDVRVTITRDGWQNAVASGVFFDPASNATIPQHVHATDTTQSSVSLAWYAVPGATSYNVYRDGTYLDSSTSTGYTDLTAAADTAYTYTVTSVTAVGESSPSTAATAQTLSDPAAGYDGLWPYTQSPQTVDQYSPQATGGLELGVQFKSDVDGYVTGVQFYKGVLNTGSHVGDLWDAAGNLLATATFTGESDSGWQQVDFAQPVAITAGQTYTASYFGTSGHYAYDQEYFQTSGTDNAPLHAPAGNNGVYLFTNTPALPPYTYNATNYWVQPVFASWPPAASGLSATAVSASEIDLAWTAVPANTTSIAVQRSTDGGATFTTFATLAPSATTQANTGLLENAEYAYQLVFTTPAGTLYSDATFAFTLPAVSGLQAVAATDTEIDLSWTSNAPDATGFEVDRSTDGGNTWTALSPLPAGTTTYADTGLSPDVDYTYQVRATRPGGPSQFTDAADAYTLPAAPDGALTATANGTNEVDLAWSDADPNVYGYDLQRSADGQTFTSIAQLNPGTTTYADTDVLDGTRYDYRVLATDASGESTPSPVASATTVLAAPSGLVATPTADGGVQLAWVDNSQVSPDFVVERSSDGQSFAPVTLDSDGIDAGGSPGTQYWYKVMAQNAVATSAASNVVTATTAPAISISGSPDTVNVGDTYTLNVTVQRSPSGPDPITSLLIDWGDGNSDSPSSHSGAFAHVYSQAGNFTVTAVAQTGAGPIVATTAVSIVTDSGTPSLSVEISASQVPPGSSVTLTPTLTGLPSGMTASQWVVDWGDGTTNGSFTHSYAYGASDGTGYEISVAAVTPLGLIAATTGVSVADPNAGPGGGRIGVSALGGTEAQPANIGVFTCGSDTPPTSFTIDFGDGSTVTVPAETTPDGNTTATAQHQYQEEGVYHVVATGGGLRADNTAIVLDGIDPSVAPIPDQLVMPGGPVTVTAAVSGLDPGEQAFAYVNWGNGWMPAQLDANGDGTGTVTAHLDRAPAVSTTARIAVYDPEGDFGSAAFNLNPYGVVLTVGAYTSPPPPDVRQDTPFIPVDDGYASDAQSVPNDQLPLPDPADPALVPASLSLNVPTGLTATWSLGIPSNVRVFRVQGDGTLAQLTSGQQFTYDPNASGDASAATIQLLVQGAATATGAAITAMMTPAGATQPARANVPENSGPQPLEVLSVKDNAPGAVLTPAQRQAGVFLPISTITKNGVGNVVYQLPIQIHNLQYNARLEVPPGWIVVDGAGTKQDTKGGGVPLKPAPNSDTTLFVEATDNGKVAGAPPKILLTQVDPNSLKFVPNFRHGGLGEIDVTAFVFSGPTDVPQYGKYQYNVTSVQGGKWLTTTAGITPVQVANDPSNVYITWGQGANLDNAVYQANPQYIWDMAVNVFSITVDPGPNGAAYGGQVVQAQQGSKDFVPGSITVKADTFNMGASIAVQGPDGTAGMQHLAIGFVQNLAPATTKAEYNNGGAKPILHGFAVGSSLLGGNQVDRVGAAAGTTFWDTQNPPTTTLYDNKLTARITGTQLLKQQTNSIVTLDAPKLTLRRDFGSFGHMDATKIVWKLSMYVVVTTDEAPAVYVPEAYLPWTFNGTGNVAGNTWTQNGAGISFRTSNQQAQWLPLEGAAAGGEPPFTTSGRQFNSLVQPSPENGASPVVFIPTQF